MHLRRVPQLEVVGAEAPRRPGQRAPRDDRDAPRQTPLRQRLVREERVRLDLVHARLDARRLEERRELRLVEVGHAERPDFSGVDERLHRGPRLAEVARGAVAREDRALLELEGPVDQEQVQVRRPEVRERVVDRGRDRVRSQLRHEELGREKKLRARNLGRLDGAADGGLVPVEPRAVEVPRAGVDDVRQNLRLDEFGRAEAHARHRAARAQLDCWRQRHSFDAPSTSLCAAGCAAGDPRC
mmetsp:Transcript_10124/g.30435  ORF Transcript_10124/g.30435 Transcript_10124/m.30435 type:complete len:242 (-) Transcript_10124:324-1049(-)